MESEVDLIEFVEGRSTERVDEGPSGGRHSGPERRLLVSSWDDSWLPHSPEQTPKKTLQCLGDDASFMDAILLNMLPSSTVEPSAPPMEPDWDVAGSSAQTSLVVEEWPFSSIASSNSSTLSLDRLDYLDSFSTVEGTLRRCPARNTVNSGRPSVRDVLPPRPRSVSPVPASPESPATHNRGKERRREGGESEAVAGVSGMSSLEAAPGPSSASPPQSPPPVDSSTGSRTHSATAWVRHSMRRIRHFRLTDPPRSPSPDPTEPPQEEQESDMAGESLSPLGQWPHGLSSMLACLACTLGIFNISRFAILSVQFGANFIIQFMVMSVMLGIPLFTFHVSLGQLLGAGTMDMWKISPIFQGIGIALLLTQALLGIYSVVGVSWMLVYFRDSFITKQDTYRWAESYPGTIHGPYWRYSNSSSVKLEETVPDYFSGIVLQRHNAEYLAHSPGHLKFQVTFNLAVVWMIVFISLSKGLKSYGKVVFLFSLVPAFGMLVLCTKLLGLTPSHNKSNMVFPQTDWSEFFLNSGSWSAAMSEAFQTWGLLGASAMQMASHNRLKHLLHRDTTFVTAITLSILILSAFLANTCSQLLLANGYLYVPSSFEKMSTYGFLHSVKSPLPHSYTNTPDRWMPHSQYLVGERVLPTGVNHRQQSGYQALRLATELVPATLAVLGSDRLSPFWSVLFYFVLILFGIAQQLAIMHCVITGIMAIKVKTMKSWETTITFCTCFCGFILGLPMATELGIFVVHFLDYCVGGGWWISLLYLIELIAVFMVRGRPYSGETIVATLFTKAGPCLQVWAAPLLSFTWNVILPVFLMVLCVSVFKSGNYRDLFRWGAPMSYEYWPTWSRQVGSLIQLIPLIIIPFICIVQTCRYLSNGPPDIFDRIQLLYRPPEETLSANEQDVTQTETEPATTTISTITIEDPPPKYTPPPSYTTATGARIAKMLRQSFRRSMRRINTALGVESQADPSQPPPPDYAAVLVEINQALTSRPTDSSESAATTSSFTVGDVATILRNSFRRAMRDNIVQSSSSEQRLVDTAAPISRDSIIPNQTEPDKTI